MDNPNSGENISALAKSRFERAEGRPLFLCDWVSALFIHFEVDTSALQNSVPFELDLRDGRAYVSLVAFTMRKLRLAFGGRAGEWLCAPITTHSFLNLRTYVRHENEPGIHFILEWLNHRLAVRLGPLAFGLPYRHGKLDYRHDFERGEVADTITPARGAGVLRYRGRTAGILPASAPHGSLTEFLLERYTAYNYGSPFLPREGGRGVRFRVWHEPWPQTPVEIQIENDSLLRENCGWYPQARLVGANLSSGVHDVWVGRPRRVKANPFPNALPQGEGEKYGPHPALTA